MTMAGVIAIRFAIPGDREIKALTVKCDNEENGCGWVGELRQLSDHTSKCEYSKVECPNNCGLFIPCRDLNNHMKSECILRRAKCPDCEEEGPYPLIKFGHPQICLKAKISCPRKCGSTIMRCDLDKHLGECPNQEVSCKYEGIGCTTKPLRKDRKKHEDDDKLHLPLALDTITKLQNDVHILQESAQVAPCVIKMANYSWFKSQDKPWYSSPFYSHPGGYKMCLKVHANGFRTGKGTHISFYLFFMRGRKLNDDSLSWPFRVEISIKLLNQLEDEHHFERTLIYKDKDDADNNRVVEGERARSGFGKPQFISQSSLNFNPRHNRQYLKDDCLYFQVSVESPSPVKPWLVHPV